ncbi:hypothetical protein E1A91_A01G038600v1 [Gossypium mustelinum]|uniref:Uncharacterized protein n=1 Tax=Gossypium mustelinum TaxID=34275 RepID=A0A5D3ABD0_GOSMU|nr:hypothetical protein E1A91_A01G038600v1 [Gossypium mustelinum]
MEPTKPKSRNLDQFMNEVAPPRFISVSKRPLTTMLATIAEEEKDFNDNEVVKGRRTYSSSVCGKAAICCLSRELESSMFVDTIFWMKTGSTWVLKNETGVATNPFFIRCDWITSKSGGF